MKITDQERNKIIKLCKKYNIENYTIKDDGTVDVDGDVNLIESNLTELPLKFGIVNGDFNCSENELNSLIGSPKEVGVSFYCDFNQLTSFEGAPEKVGMIFNCKKNPKDNPKELEQPLTIIYGEFINI